MTVFKGLTATHEYVKAVSSNKTILLFDLTLLDKEGRKVCVILPPLEECKRYCNYLLHFPQDEEDLCITFIERYGLKEEDKTWLTSDALAGHLTSIFRAVMEIGFPRGLDNIDAMLESARNNQDIYGQMREFLVAAGNFNSLDSYDSFAFYKLVALSEARMKKEGLIDQPLKFESVSQDSPEDRTGYINDVDYNELLSNI